MSLIYFHALSYNANIIFLNETFVDSSVETNDPKINIPGLNLLRSNHPSNSKRRGVCMYYKIYSTVIRHDNRSALAQCIVTEKNFGKNLYSVSATIDILVKLLMNLSTTVKIFI